MSTQQLEIYQLVHTLSYGDAISTEVLALDRIFNRQGIKTKILALHVHPKLKDRAEVIKEFNVPADSKIILHYSLGSPLNQHYLNFKGGQRYLVYHNLTPAHWFAGVNPRVVEDLKQGILELPILCQQSDLIVADSEFNASEIKQHGFAAVVLDLPFDQEKWSIAANAGITSLLADRSTINVLHVGRTAPNKCVEDIIKTFYFLHHKIVKNSVLWLVGMDTDTELYSFALRRLVHELDLEESVRFVGHMADEEVKALYQASSVYMCMSEHEGFCLPILEAMYFGLPVIAYASSAVTGTLGSAGILVKEKRHAELAELIFELQQNSSLRQKLINTGHERVRDFSLEIFQKRAVDLFCNSEISK